MKISIITITYNSEQTIRDTLKSVGKQDYLDIEHIIIDGRSTDNTISIINEFPYVSKLLSEKDKGIYDAMNKGVELAQGEIIGILNSDDVYTNHRVISKVMRAFEDKTVDAVYGDLQYVKRDDLNKVIRTWKSGEYDQHKFYFGWMPPHPSFFVRKKVYEVAGKFNLNFSISADYEFMLRALMKYNFKAKYVPGVFVKMRVGGNSNGSLGKRIKANTQDKEAWKVNNLKPYFFSVPLKPIRKIFQYLIK
jgi:glycosyltransferase involved in cell wall biosynthesis